ncbi:cytochrome c551 [Pullulanibacillus pueri]|uniref:Cytochrome c domain-containing protein n=1 Tax=Pullulanibacillus pueri TaxID=1437324 RepID=A0A8J2ZUC9_9BACL|nr:cytochrome c [Pullulanibacillus pueri]MBM7681251.1 cytochrome c551 [Pullulanibacillus pueri]GGH77879.1 hypothetical protein GCM10007096_10430 [Pullulanibacillus pueri]
MKQIMVLISGFILAIGITACGGNDNNDNDNNNKNSSSSETKTSVDATAANKVYQQNCASCHGKNLEGAAGPTLKTIGKDMSKDRILKQINQGGGGMPAGLIKGDDADNVAAWLASKK